MQSYFSFIVFVFQNAALPLTRRHSGDVDFGPSIPHVFFVKAWVYYAPNCLDTPDIVKFNTSDFCSHFHRLYPLFRARTPTAPHFRHCLTLRSRWALNARIRASRLYSLLSPHWGLLLQLSYVSLPLLVLHCYHFWRLFCMMCTDTRAFTVTLSHFAPSHFSYSVSCSAPHVGVCVRFMVACDRHHRLSMRTSP